MQKIPIEKLQKIPIREIPKIYNLKNCKNF